MYMYFHHFDGRFFHLSIQVLPHSWVCFNYQVIQAVVMILESDHTSDIKEQTLCILGNVADGDASKEYIMNNDDILKKILDYMVGEDKKLNWRASGKTG